MSRIDVRRLRGLLAAVAMAVVAAIGGAVEVAVAAPPADPLDVTREFYKALHAGDARAAAKLTTAVDAEPVLRSFVRISKSYRALEAALAKRFGADAAEQVGYGRKVQDEVKALLGATAEIEGDMARVAALDGQTITTLRKVKGAWRIELEDALDTAEGRAAFSAQAQATEDASKQVVSRVREGKYATPRTAVDDFEARIARAAAGVRRGAPPQRSAPEPEGTQL
jgi:enoyl reductase-like protein